MTKADSNAIYAISLTLIATFVLSIWPIPISMQHFRPDWTLLVLVYWTLVLPHRVHIGVAWLSGFFLDVLLGTVLGVHALSFALVVYITAANYLRIRNWSWLHQCCVMVVLLSLHHLLVYWLSYFLSETYFLAEYLYAVIPSVALWPLIWGLLERFRNRFVVN